MNTNYNEQTVLEHIRFNERLALSYRDAYKTNSVRNHSIYEAWKFAKGATYWSPYFGDEMIDLNKSPVSVADSAAFEALCYSIKFPDWGIIDFEYWAAPDGAAWKTHYGGHTKDGVFKDFYAYSFIKTNADFEITHWETHVNAAYDDFLDIAIGTHGPFLDKGGTSVYMQAVNKTLAEAGIDTDMFKK